VREHLEHGVSRRIDVLWRAIENIYREFPPSITHRLTVQALSDVQINLQAFVMNLFGIFDNWAWAFILRHDLEEFRRDKKRVNLFSKQVAKRLPPALRSWILAPTIKRWHKEHLKPFRDTLAHRIPLYVPPAEFAPEDAARDRQLWDDRGRLWEQLLAEGREPMRTSYLQRLESLAQESDKIGRPSFVFSSSLSDNEAPYPTLIHSQLLADAFTVVEFGDLFLKHWHECVQPGGGLQQEGRSA
jgi:hypothetical protein